MEEECTVAARIEHTEVELAETSIGGIEAGVVGVGFGPAEAAVVGSAAEPMGQHSYCMRLALAPRN